MKIKTLSLVLSLTLIGFLLNSCGAGAAKLPAEGEKLMAHAWKYDVNANITKGTDEMKDKTNISADIELKGDVGKLAKFSAPTLSFARDKKDKAKLAYKKQFGEGALSTSVLGYWEISDDGKTLTLKEWDAKAGKEKDPEVFNIKEINDQNLVLVDKNQVSHTYKAK